MASFFKGTSLAGDCCNCENQPSPCSGCDESPPCTVYIRCEYKEQTYVKCGWVGFTDPATRFQQIEVTLNNELLTTFSATYPGCDSAPTTHSTLTLSLVRTTTSGHSDDFEHCTYTDCSTGDIVGALTVINEGFEHCGAPGGTDSETVTGYDCDNDPGGWFADTHLDPDSNPAYSHPLTCDAGGLSWSGGSTSNVSGTWTADGSGVDGLGNTCDYTNSLTINLSSEYTTTSLIDDTYAEVSDWPDDEPGSTDDLCGCGAYRKLDSDEQAFHYRRTRFFYSAVPFEEGADCACGLAFDVVLYNIPNDGAIGCVDKPVGSSEVSRTTHHVFARNTEAFYAITPDPMGADGYWAIENIIVTDPCI